MLVPVWNVPSGMKKAPTVIPIRIRNLKNQNLKCNHVQTHHKYRKQTEGNPPPLTSIRVQYDLNKFLPILNSCTWVFAATDANHDGTEQKEEAGHGKTHTVHRLVAHEDITVKLVLNREVWSSFAKSWDLRKRRKSDEKKLVTELINIKIWYSKVHDSNVTYAKKKICMSSKRTSHIRHVLRQKINTHLPIHSEN